MTTPTTPAADAVREAFERYADSMDMSVQRRTAGRSNYVTSTTAHAWHAWKCCQEMFTVRESALVAERDALRATASDLLVALRDLEAMAERYRQPGQPFPDAHKRAIAAIANGVECIALAAPAVEGE